MKKVQLKKGREFSVTARRHPWIFSGALEPTDAGAEMVEVFGADGARLGVGFHSPASQIRVRMMPEAPIADLVAASIGRRASFYADDTVTAIRLVNAENDQLPGVVADCYAGWIICQFTSAGAEHFKGKIAAALMRFAPFCRGVCERTDVEVRGREGLPVGKPGEAFAVLAGEEPPELVEIKEGQCYFLVDVRRGQKTGFYLDQREARAAVGPLANGADVLNCFSYTGGFGLAARACGALSVTQVDASADALALAKKNEALQHFCGTKMDYVEADVFQYLRRCRDEGRKFDMVILDPPKFAAAKSQVMKAARGYKDINLLAMKLLRPNGILATFSCSGAISSDLFDKIVAEAASDAGRDFQTIARTRQGADHPVALSFPDGWYLKGLILRGLG